MASTVLTRESHKSSNMTLPEKEVIHNPRHTSRRKENYTRLVSRQTQNELDLQKKKEFDNHNHDDIQPPQKQEQNDMSIKIESDLSQLRKHWHKRAEEFEAQIDQRDARILFLERELCQLQSRLIPIQTEYRAVLRLRAKVAEQATTIEHLEKCLRENESRSNLWHRSSSSRDSSRARIPDDAKLHSLTRDNVRAHDFELAGSQESTSKRSEQDNDGTKLFNSSGKMFEEDMSSVRSTTIRDCSSTHSIPILTSCAADVVDPDFGTMEQMRERIIELSLEKDRLHNLMRARPHYLHFAQSEEEASNVPNLYGRNSIHRVSEQYTNPHKDGTFGFDQRSPSISFSPPPLPTGRQAHSDGDILSWRSFRDRGIGWRMSQRHSSQRHIQPASNQSLVRAHLHRQSFQPKEQNQRYRSQPNMSLHSMSQHGGGSKVRESFYEAPITLHLPTQTTARATPSTFIHESDMNKPVHVPLITVTADQNQPEHIPSSLTEQREKSLDLEQEVNGKKDDTVFDERTLRMSNTSI